jgi:hypothetical protein
MLASVQKYVIILHIFTRVTFFIYGYFFFIKNKSFLPNVDLCFFRSFYFVIVFFL